MKRPRVIIVEDVRQEHFTRNTSPRVRNYLESIGVPTYDAMWAIVDVNTITVMYDTITAVKVGAFLESIEKLSEAIFVSAVIS